MDQTRLNNEQLAERAGYTQHQVRTEAYSEVPRVTVEAVQSILADVKELAKLNPLVKSIKYIPEAGEYEIVDGLYPLPGLDKSLLSITYWAKPSQVSRAQDGTVTIVNRARVPVPLSDGEMQIINTLVVAPLDPSGCAIEEHSEIHFPPPARMVPGLVHKLLLKSTISNLGKSHKQMLQQVLQAATNPEQEVVTAYES